MDAFTASWRIAKRHPDDPAGAALAVARAFEGKPYRAATLDDNPGERMLIDRFDAFDCWTLVEVATAVALSAAPTEQPNIDGFRDRLRALRYRHGRMQGYGSRLHYFSEWLRQGEAAGLFTDITQQLPGVVVDARPIRYMSLHPDRYPELADPNQLAAVHAAEVALSQTPRHFIPKQRVAAIEDQLIDGDIIALTSTKPGLDIAHQGFALRHAGRTWLVHASSEFGRVMVSKVPLSDYLKRNRSHGGIVVARWRNS